MPQRPPPLPPRRPSGEYSYAAREMRPAVPSEQPAPSSSLSPPGVKVQIDERGFDARVRGEAWKRLTPWLVPAVMSVLGWLGSGILGYFEGLKKGAARVAAMELAIDDEKAMIELTRKTVNHEEVVTDDHDQRLLRLERTLKLDPQAAAILASPSLVVKQAVVP